jgi:hypothetical protein
MFQLPATTEGLAPLVGIFACCRYQATAVTGRFKTGFPAFRMMFRFWDLLAQLKTCGCPTMKAGVSLA